MLRERAELEGDVRYHVLSGMGLRGGEIEERRFFQ